MLVESRGHRVCERLRPVPFLGAIRVASRVARRQTPYRFRTKRQFWAYCGLALETRSSADYRWVDGQLQRSRKKVLIRGLNVNHNQDLKNIFKGAALSGSIFPGPLKDFYEQRRAAGIAPGKATPPLTPQIAARALILCKKGENFDPPKLDAQP